jgi:hypothetical protein
VDAPSNDVTCDELPFDHLKDYLVPARRETARQPASEDGRQNWITVKGGDGKAAERLAETILRCLAASTHYPERGSSSPAQIC